MYDHRHWIEQLQLTAHPEGGYFRETYRAAESIDNAALPTRFGGDRAFATGIYFLLTADTFSAFHRIQSDEMWHFYYGHGLQIHQLQADGQYAVSLLGGHPERGESFQQVVPAGSWFGATVIEQNNPDPDMIAYALVGCTVAPGFDFTDFELATGQQLTASYPDHHEIIGRLTRG